jgi:hypothetical protein
LLAERALHGAYAAGDQRGFRHQAGTEAAVLHPVRRAADIEVDLVVAVAFADGRGLRQPGRIGAAQLQRDRMLRGIEGEQAVSMPVHHGLRRHHLRVQPRAPRQQPVEEPAMPIRPVHHGSDAEFVV